MIKLTHMGALRQTINFIKPKENAEIKGFL